MSAEALHSQNTIANILHQFKGAAVSNQGRAPSSSSFRTSTSRSSDDNSLERVPTVLPKLEEGIMSMPSSERSISNNQRYMIKTLDAQIANLNLQRRGSLNRSGTSNDKPTGVKFYQMQTQKQCTPESLQNVSINNQSQQHVRKLDFRTTPAFKQSLVKVSQQDQQQQYLEASEYLSSKITMQERIIVKKNPQSSSSRCHSVQQRPPKGVIVQQDLHQPNVYHLMRRQRNPTLSLNQRPRKLATTHTNYHLNTEGC